MPLRAPALLTLAAALTLTACAAAPPPASPSVLSSEPAAAPPSASAAPSILLEPKGSSPVDGEMMAIARAEDEIDRLFPAAAASKAPARGKKGDSAADATKGGAAKEEQQSGGDGCATACRALASMTRSADHLCQMAGETDGRCEDARARVAGARGRVKAACPACAPQP
jgi:hypothetical protein